MLKLSPLARRAHLIEAMKQDAAQGLHCGSCSGTCCTFTSNSMQIDAEQALDMKNWLVQQERWNEETFKSLEDCVEEFRLDKEISHIKIRRTYTCPFFKRSSLGCTIAPEVKPYGCLAFNPKEAGVTNGGNCRSNLDLLEAVPGIQDGVKHPIPVALLRLR